MTYDWLTKLTRAPADEGTPGGDAPADTGAAPAEELVLGGGVKFDAPKPEDAKPEDAKPEDAKPEDAKPEDAKPDAPKPDAPKPEDAVPGEDEKYEFTVPEGTEIDAQLAEAVQPVLKELGLTKGQADKLATFMAGYQATTGQQIVDTYLAAQKDYVAAAKADDEIGKANWDASTKQANQALQKFGTPGLVAALREHGLANHPEMIRFCSRVGQRTANDTLDTGEHVDTTSTPPEERWYGKTTATTKKR
jgi:hypothetical protein